MIKKHKFSIIIILHDVTKKLNLAGKITIDSQLQLDLSNNNNNNKSKHDYIRDNNSIIIIIIIILVQ